MKPGMIDTSRIEAMVSQVRSAAAAAKGDVRPVGAEKPATRLDFAAALRASLDAVNDTQQKSEQIGQRFALGDDSVNLSDVMIAMQKANISFQGTVQVRNKLVSAYQDIMNMQV